MMLLDSLLFIVICICTVYCVRLSKRITNLQNIKDQFVEEIKLIDATLFKTEDNISKLLIVSKNIPETFKKDLQVAKDLINELSLINSIAGKLAERLEKQLNNCRNLEKENQKNDNLIEVNDNEFLNFYNNIKDEDLSENEVNMDPYSKKELPNKNTILDQLEYFNSF